ncbi:PEP/pyruvate-binding domain-containing protein [Paenibacillus donghaensis]|uniref:Phosphoenolpyruvate synthase n=1 Tax=Paenibacillus donghaensis TaxID=414771 RepID=A0A2Z2KG47_9BACL|nr:PEP/pyruvate-binding domain-containing protein [Paenibacillus donghaensis]ASA24797.1 hypothetical protein B9T62_30985 [Paenibacillus donghaensis]
MATQAISYRKSMDFEHLKVDLAVVVQAMIPAEAAGVMFTANPVNENTEEVMISAGYGLGEAVVSGLITPELLGPEDKIIYQGVKVFFEVQRLKRSNIHILKLKFQRFYWFLRFWEFIC